MHYFRTWNELYIINFERKCLGNNIFIATNSWLQRNMLIRTHSVMLVMFPIVLNLFLFSTSFVFQQHLRVGIHKISVSTRYFEVYYVVFEGSLMIYITEFFLSYQLVIINQADSYLLTPGICRDRQKSGQRHTSRSLHISLWVFSYMHALWSGCLFGVHSDSRCYIKWKKKALHKQNYKYIRIYGRKFILLFSLPLFYTVKVKPNEVAKTHLT